VQRIGFLAADVSAIIQWALILVVAVLPIVLNVDAVRRMRRSAVVGSRFSWRRLAAYVGAASNGFVYVLPVTLLIHNMIVNAPWDSDPVQDAMVALTLLSIVLAIVGPKNVRPQLIIGVLLPFFFWLLFVSRGIL
jgi:hypothetical protein